MPRKLLEIVKTYDLEPIVPDAEGTEPFRFRIEVLREGGGRRFRAKVYRIESLRVRPSFSVHPGTADHEVIVADDHVGAEPFEGRSVDAVVRKVLARIDVVFGPSGAPRKGASGRRLRR